MKNLNLIVIAGAIWLSVFTSATTYAQRAPRYAVEFQDGTRLEGNAFTDWQVTNGVPKLDTKPLLEPANPIRWLRDRSVTSSVMSGPYVELYSGDRIPGAVVAFRHGDEQTYDIVPSHFEVKPLCELKSPQPQEFPFVRVVSRYVRKVVWEPRRTANYEPQKLFLRDGGVISYKAIRLSESSASVLVGAELRKIPFDAIAELHLGTEPWWTLHFDELATLTPDGTSRIFQLTTSDGLTVTSSLARFVALAQGAPNEPHRWVHGWQPAWTLDTLWLPVAKIATWQTFSATEVSLVRMPPSKVNQRPGLASPTRVLTDRNVLGGPLRVGGLSFVAGVGCQAWTELTYDLHPAVKSFRSRFGIDMAAESGGCVRFRVMHPTANDVRYDSQPIVGSKNVGDTAVIPLAWRDQGGCSLVIQADSAHAERPAGADPFEIRDFADWLQPLIELDADKVKAELNKRLLRSVPAWQDWLAVPEPGGEAKRVQVPEEGAANIKELRLGVVAASAPLAITSQRKLAPKDRWLVITATRVVDVPPNQRPKFEVRLGNELVGEFEPTLLNRASRDLVPIMISLDAFRHVNRPIDLFISQLPDATGTPVVWRGLRVTEAPPTLATLPSAPDTLNPMGAGAPPTAPIPFEQSGIKVVVNEPKVTQAEQPLRIRERPALGEFRFVRFAFQKPSGGRVALEFTKSEPDAVQPSYDCGVGPPTRDDAKRVWTATLAKDPVIITRDLFADFGPFDLTSLSMVVPDGEPAFFQRVQFARTQQDFELANRVVPGAVLNDQQRTDLRKVTVDRCKTSWVKIDLPEGKKCQGVVISPEGEILTAGNVLIGPGRDVSVRFADGKVVKGKSQGVSRASNLGLIKLEGGGPFVPFPMNPDRNLPLNGIYLSPTVGQNNEPDGAAVVTLRRTFRDELWCDNDSSHCAPGTPVLNGGYQLIGIAARPSQFGGVLVRHLATINEELPRLRKDEVWGTWALGTEPPVGATPQLTAEGVILGDIIAEGPAAKAGLRANDVLVSLDGQAIATVDAAWNILRAKDPGQTVVVEFRRGTNVAKANVVVSARAW